jgi:hypothetical protein
MGFIQVEERRSWCEEGLRRRRLGAEIASEAFRAWSMITLQPDNNE